ncbi:hypothetical protein FHX08_001055 [Rhizobium sp. BK529]|nr:hypothetical protein [Rhizobium sp. BK529]
MQRAKCRHLEQGGGRQRGKDGLTGLFGVRPE